MWTVFRWEGGGGGDVLQRFTSGTNLLPQVIEVAFQEANIAPGPECQTPTYFGAQAGSPGPAGGRVAPPSDRDLRGAPLPPGPPLPPAGPWGLGAMWGWRARTSVSSRERPWAALGRGLQGGLCCSSSPPPHIPLFWRGGPGGAKAPLRRPPGGGGSWGGAWGGRRGTARDPRVRCALGSLGQEEGGGGCKGSRSGGRGARRAGGTGGTQGEAAPQFQGPAVLLFAR